jgi:hypothetical protein
MPVVCFAVMVTSLPFSSYQQSTKRKQHMCNEHFNERLAPLNRQHLVEVQAQYPEQANFAASVYEVLTKNLTPQVNLLVTFVALKQQFDEGRQGIFGAFGRVLYAPLSIVAKTGVHEWTRFRPQAVEELHTSFLSFMMAKPNRQALNRLLGRYDLAFSQGHCCGILFGRAADVAAYENSPLFARRNVMRSYAEAMAMPVVSTSFAEIPAENSDLGPTEQDFYDRYEQTFARMLPQGRLAHCDYVHERIWESIVVNVPQSVEDLMEVA